MVNAEALEATITALALRPEHEALAQAARGLAAAVDGKPDNASLWNQYREALDALLKAAPQANEDDGHAELLSIVRPPVRDPKKPRKKDAGAGGRTGRRRAGDAADAVAGTGRGRSRRASS